MTITIHGEEWWVLIASRLELIIPQWAMQLGFEFRDGFSIRGAASTQNVAQHGDRDPRLLREIPLTRHPALPRELFESVREVPGEHDQLPVDCGGLVSDFHIGETRVFPVEGNPVGSSTSGRHDASSILELVVSVIASRGWSL